MHLRWSVLSAVLVFCSCAAKVWNTARCTSEMECVKLKCSFCFSNALYAMQHNASVTVKCSFESSPVHNASVLSAVLSVLLPPPRYRLLCSTLRVLELLTTLNSGNTTYTWCVVCCVSVCVYYVVESRWVSYDDRLTCLPPSDICIPHWARSHSPVLFCICVFKFVFVSYV